MSYKHFDYAERIKLKTFIDEGYTNAEIARRLYRSRASITQELKRNARVVTWKGKTKILRHTYEPVQAQRRADHLATEAHRKPTKLTKRRQEHIDYLIKKKQWSPQQIANGVKNIGVSTGTIYNWILKRLINSKMEDLPLKGKRRKKLRAKKVNSVRTRAILESHSIKKRPKVINERQTFGHWEIDGVMSPQDAQNFVVTFVERKTRFMVGIKARSRQFEDMQTVLDTFMSRFAAACESITCDRGIEFTSTNFIHSVENTYNKKIYFSDPQAPGQRGTNERLNRELRRIYPVGYNFTKITQKRLQESIRDLNRRPRHVLGYQTPEHEFIRRMNEIIQKSTMAASI